MHAPKRRSRKSVEKVGLPECLRMPRNVGLWSLRPLHTKHRQESELRHGTNPYSFKRLNYQTPTYLSKRAPCARAAGVLTPYVDTGVPAIKARYPTVRAPKKMQT